jgi:PAS domain S-box-containing protein
MKTDVIHTVLAGHGDALTFDPDHADTVRRDVELNAILNYTADAILAVDSDGHVMRFNRQFADMWRLPQRLLDVGDDAALLTAVLDQFEDPESFLTRVRDLYASARNDMDTLAFKDGRVIERYSSPLLLRGENVGRVWSFRDVTHRKLAEQAMMHSEQRHRAIVMSAMDGYLLGDLNGRILEVNNVCCLMHGYSEQEMLGMRVGELVCDQERQIVALRCARLADVGAERFETRHRRKDGSEFDVEVSRKVLPGDGGWVVGFIRDISDIKRAREKVAEHIRQLEVRTRGTLQAVSNMLALRDPYTSGHERRVALIAADIGRELGWAEDRCEDLAWTGQVHDIGKVGVPAEILSKPGLLTSAERGLVQTHADLGYEILRDIEFQSPVAEIIRQHHERIDGSGYPQGLKGDSILIEARILAVADVLESMSSHRPYRPARGLDAALQEVESHRGSWYDADVVDAVLRMIRDKGYVLPT